MSTIEERLRRCEIDLALSYECLAIEQEGAKQVERELSQTRRELNYARAQFHYAQRDLKVAARQVETTQNHLRLAGKQIKVQQAHVRHVEEAWQSAEQRRKELEFENSLLGLDLEQATARADHLEESLYLSEERRLDEQEERVRLTRRLIAAQERVRELEVMLCERSPSSPVRLEHTLQQLLGNKQLTGSVACSTSAGRTQVEGWMASWSLT